MKVYIFATLFIIIILLTFCHFVYGTTYTFLPRGDSYVDEANTSLNYGTNTNLRIKGTTKSNALVQFSQSEILASIGTQHVVSATLKLYVESNFNGWGSGTYMDAHRVSAEWDETSVTWSCANTDCEDLWQGGYYEDYISDSVFQQNSQTGWSSFNVTSDVQLLQNGFTHYGWLIRKRDYSNLGSLDYTSVQGTSVLKPQLVVVTDNQACSPSTIDSVSPGLIPSDGTSQTITVSGTNLNAIQLVKVDNSTISYTLVNNSTITFTLNYSSVGSHEIWFRSNCLTEALDLYIIEANTLRYNQSLPDSQGCKAASGVSNFALNTTTTPKKLCWKGAATRLLGYSGSFSLINWDHLWLSDNTSTILPARYQAVQFNGAAPGSGSWGTNSKREFAMGGSCNLQIKKPNGIIECKGYQEDGSTLETMPFKKTTDNKKYKLSVLTEDGSKLFSGWKIRLGNLIKYADQNGIAVTISLFDENTMKANDQWPNNPWNPDNNDLSCTGWSNARAFPEFYKICQDGSNPCPDTKLTCLGNIEKNYVKSIVQTVKNLNICQDTRCKNVIFEVMNEALYDEAWDDAGCNPCSTVDEFMKWHNTVAGWVRNLGSYMVQATVKQKETNPCGPNNNYDDCRVAACTTSSCPNYFQALFASNIKIVSFHVGTWKGDICGMYQHTSKFGKPMIFDEDGTADNVNQSVNFGNPPPTCPPPPNTIGSIEQWAQDVSSGIQNTCGQAKGKVHFYQTHDGIKKESTPPSGNGCNQSTETSFIDCKALEALADGAPDKYCNNGTCVLNRSTYCDSCSQNCLSQ